MNQLGIQSFAGYQAVSADTGNSNYVRRAIVILGMHRSGTSALTRVLSLMGCALPQTLVPAGANNPTGHWESWPICQLNDDAFATACSDYLDWRPLNPAWSEQAIWNDLIARGRTVLRSEFGAAPLLVVKDPRMCRFVPLWREVLMHEEITPSYVLALRAPDEVAQSMLAGTYGVDAGQVWLLWLRHMLDAEAETRGQRRAVVTFDALCHNWRDLVDKLGERLGQAWPDRDASNADIIDGFLNQGQRRHHSNATLNDNKRLPTQVSTTYAILARWALHGEDPADYDLLDTLKREFDAACELFSAPMVAAHCALTAAQTQLKAAVRRHALDLAAMRETFLRHDDVA